MPRLARWSTKPLRLLAERDAKLQALRATLQAAIDEDVWYTEEEVFSYVRERLAGVELAQKPPVTRTLRLTARARDDLDAIADTLSRQAAR